MTQPITATAEQIPLTPKAMTPDIQETELYKKFKKALNINNDMQSGPNPFVVECCQITEQYATQRDGWISVKEQLPEYYQVVICFDATLSATLGVLITHGEQAMAIRIFIPFMGQMKHSQESPIGNPFPPHQNLTPNPAVRK